MSEFSTFIAKTLPILAAIFVTVFCLIVITRIILNYLLNHAVEKLRALKKSDRNIFAKKDQKKFIKEEEELLRSNKIPRAHSAVKAENRARGGNPEQSGTYEIMPSVEQEQERREMNEINIVDIVKPVGFWTSMILGQKLTYLVQSAQILNKRGDKGFWASMIEAKERAAGRQHSRGR